MSEWKNGDLALVQVVGQPGPERAAWIESPGGPEWVPLNRSRPLGRLWVANGRVTALHRLAVIDPEDGYEVTRLTKLIRGEWGQWKPRDHAPTGLDIQDALLEFANPTPRPAEPTNVGAVVRDRGGLLWALTDATGFEDEPLWERLTGNTEVTHFQTRDWSELDIPHDGIVFEGVEP